MVISNKIFRHTIFLCLIFVSIPAIGENPDKIDVDKDTTARIQESGLKGLIDASLLNSTNENRIREILTIGESIAVQDSAQEAATMEYNRLFLPLEYSRPFFSDVWKIKKFNYSFNQEPQWVKVDLASSELNPKADFQLYFIKDSIRKELNHRLIFDYPEWVTKIQKALPNESMIRNEKLSQQETKRLEDFFNPNRMLIRIDSTHNFNIKLQNRGYWYTLNKLAVQFSQNYISTNWQQGGESNLSMLGQLNMKANYFNPKGFTLYNDLEWKSSFYTAPTDTMRSWRLNDDIFRISSNLAIKAAQKWNYSIATEFKTRFFNSFKTNSNTKLASFLSPGEFSFGVGMSLECDFPKLNINGFSLVLSPYSYNWKYIADKNVDVTRYGLTSGTQFLKQVGSRIDMKLNYNMKKNIKLYSTFYYFTTYENVESEWENTLDFIINRYFSTKIFLHMKYNNKRILKSGEDSYFQFKELLSFGLNYIW